MLFRSAVIALLVPALFVRAKGISETASDPNISALSMGVAGVLVVLYIGSLVFSLRTHENLFQGTEEEPEAPPVWSRAKAMTILLACTTVVSIESEILVHSIEPVLAQWHIGKLFLGVILLPIIGNAAEHSTAVMMAAKNKMDVALNIAISSSTQIAMFVAPLIIFVSPFLGHPVTILFSNYELIAISSAAAIGVLISMDGKSHWLEGAQLLAVYVIVGLAFYYIAH